LTHVCSYLVYVYAMVVTHNRTQINVLSAFMSRYVYFIDKYKQRRSARDRERDTEGDVQRDVRTARLRNEQPPH